jgi:Uma2 family endonuclease
LSAFLRAYHRRVSEAIAFISFESFVDEEQSSERRHELVGGRIYAMAGRYERHDLAAGLLFELLAPGAGSAGCRPFTSNRLVRTRGGNAYYPDVMVVCGPAAHRLYEADPAVLIEVLSPATADQDRREKAVAYAESVSLALLALVDPDVRRIEVARPVDGAIRSWAVYGPGDVISSPFGDIDVDALYDTIDQTAPTT